jgi:hypothetical protein
MANEFTGEWECVTFNDDDPTTTQVPEGTFVIDPHGSPPSVVTGRRRLNGVTTEFRDGRINRGPSGRRILRILLVEADGREFIFRGHTTAANPNVISAGSYRRRGGGPASGETGTWEGTKQGPGEDEDARGRSQSRFEPPWPPLS